MRARRNVQAEKSLQQEVTLRLRAASVPLLAVPVPNSIWIPTHNDDERAMAARIINSMKKSGQLIPGAADMCLLGHKFSAALEFKRPASRTLFSKRAAGRPSEEQIEFAELCERHGVNHAYVTSWDEVQVALAGWGVEIGRRIN